MTTTMILKTKKKPEAKNRPKKEGTAKRAAAKSAPPVTPPVRARAFTARRLLVQALLESTTDKWLEAFDLICEGELLPEDYRQHFGYLAERVREGRGLLFDGLSVKAREQCERDIRFDCEYFEQEKDVYRQANRWGMPGNINRQTAVEDFLSNLDYIRKSSFGIIQQLENEFLPGYETVIKSGNGGGAE